MMSSNNNNIPLHLQIRVIHADDDILVIDKPANLRSVPGHANSPTDTTIKLKRPSDRLTAVEAWIEAIKSIPPDNNDSPRNESVKELLHNIRTANNLSSIPRKLEPFARHVFRNRKRLLPSHVDDDEPDSSTSEPPQKKKRKDGDLSQKAKQSSILPSLRNAADEAFSIIKKLHIPLMSLPTPTEDWESAQGQLRLRGYGDFANENNHNLPAKSSCETSKLHVVHRLDCQTSGVMVFARNSEAASKLCKAWRERDAVQKTYLAHVACWPPYEEQKLEEGTIELPLAASRTERIKWEVRELNDGGKPSITKWKINKGAEDGVILELHPISGRTHQLRIHCAEVGSGITGDSLYGDSPVQWFKDPDQSGTDASIPAILRLHAQMLSLRHPRSGDELTFKAPRLW